ncbi:FG-GAP repeat protein [Streptomyces sp. ISL-98]|nr:FG-GAP repeat protein [Streptomyces sp. ISL-98]
MRGKGFEPRKSHAYRPLSLKRRAWLTVGAVVLGGAGAVTVAIANPDADPAQDGLQPRRAEVHALAFKGTGSTKRDLPRTGTEPFSLVGVTWADPDAEIDGTAEVRTRSRETGEWGKWLEVHLDQHLAEKRDAKAKLPGMSEPLWVGASDGVEARILKADGTSTAGLPKGLELTLVDPGVTAKEAKAPGADAQTAAYAVEATETPAATPTPTPSDPATETAVPTPTDSATATESATAMPTDTATATESATATPSPTPTVPTAPPSTVTRPPMTLRAGWGPEKSLATNYSDPEYIEKVQAVFVHHTVDSNNYSCAESPAIIRATYAYHVTPRPDEKYDGWKDIGYNFLVDKCGQIFEGREGGVDLPVLGAHTYGFNSYSTGIALLGDFESGKPTQAALDSAARVAAWKLGQYGVSPTGTVTLEAAADTGKYARGQKATLNTVSGHRDGFATVCPGANLYSKLPAIRKFAVGPGRNSAIPTTDVNRDGITDLAVGTPKVASGDGTITVLPGSTDGPVAGARRTLNQNSPGVPGSSEGDDRFGSSSAYGDVNGDGFADLVVGAPGENGTSTQVNTGAVTVMYGPGLTTGTSYWTNTATRTSGEALGATVATGDFNADGRSDVFSVAPGKPGRWWAWDSKTGAAKNGYLNTAAYTGAVSYASAASGDFNRDGYADVAVSYRDPAGAGRLLWLKGSSTGLQRVGILTARGGRSLASGDINGDGYTDLAVGLPSATESGHTAKGGAVSAVFGSPTGLTSTGAKTVHQDTAGVPGGGETGDDLGASVSVGDVNLDGYGDILAGQPGEDLTRSGVSYANAGQSVLLLGTSTGPTGTGSVAYSQDTSGVPGAAEANDRFGSAVSLTDLSGFTRADLAIGADGEDAGNGTVLQLDNSSTNGVVASSGIYYSTTPLGAPTGAAIGKVLNP